ncbi:hypothetical protein KC19_VG320600, partial [Ceratodon purpureus]
LSSSLLYYLRVHAQGEDHHGSKPVSDEYYAPSSSLHCELTRLLPPSIVRLRGAQRLFRQYCPWKADVLDSLVHSSRLMVLRAAQELL